MLNRIALSIFCLLIPLQSWAAWDKGFNFRTTTAFVTDGTNETYVLEIDTYPTTRNGVTFGYTTTSCLTNNGGGTRDRSNTVDRRIAGIHFLANQATSCTFQIDLPAAGAYTIQMGFGDAGANAQTNYINVKDNSTSLISFQPLNTLATPTFGDAAGSTFTGANWPGSEATVSKTFATTTCNIVLAGTQDIGTNTVFDHFFISQVPETNKQISIFRGAGSIQLNSGAGSIRSQ